MYSLWTFQMIKAYYIVLQMFRQSTCSWKTQQSHYVFWINNITYKNWPAGAYSKTDTKV